MKKLIIIFIICFIFSPLYIFADEEDAEDIVNAEETEIAEDGEYDQDDFHKERGPFRIKDRKVEVGFMNISAGFANDFLTSSKIFKDKVVIDLRELDKGFRLNFDLGFTPFYFKYNKLDENWGFGISLDFDAAGALDLSGSMLTLEEAAKEKSDVSGAAFMDLKSSAYFPIQKFKAKVGFSLYYPLLYVDPFVSYTLRTTPSGASDIDLQYRLRVFTPMPMEDNNESLLTSIPGADICLGVEYPLAEVLGLKDKFHFLDFIVGLDLINIPLVPSSMKSYMDMAGRIASGGPINIDDFDNYFETDDTKYGSKKKMIVRPFKMLTWAEWKPFDLVPVSFIPTFGFAVNPMYSKPGSVEAGIKSRFDIANLFIASLGMGYYDRLWKNSIDLALNFRFVEINFGVDLRSQSFTKSWTGGGFGFNFGLKFGK